MRRRSRLMMLVLVGGLALVGCRAEPQPTTPQPGELPPLPPASGTAVGYLVDSARRLELRDEQLAELKRIDTSLAARNDTLDTQLRLLERPEAPPEVERGQPAPRYNNAPGASVVSSPEARKLHEAKRANDREALERAFAVLEPAQQETARALLADRGIQAPKPAAPAPAPAPSPGP